MTASPAGDFGQILAAIPELATLLRRGTQTYDLLAQVLRDAVESSDLAGDGRGNLGELGQVVLPFHEMGAITTLDLFGLDELILFALYSFNQDRYRTAADLGANVGLHSIVMGNLGWNVQAFEADPQTAELLRRNLELNDMTTVTVENAAVSDRAGQSEFVRVLGNLTGSHLSGAKTDPYGDLERFLVPTVGIATIMETVDFIKMDVEGSEARILVATSRDDWAGTDLVLEIGSKGNAESIFAHLTELGINMHSQKIGWGLVKSFDELPFHHTQGSVFCSAHTRQPFAS